MQQAQSQSLVELTASNTQTTKLSIFNVSADEIDVEYRTMPGNQPNTYGNFLAIWQNSNSIPWNTEPLKTFPIPTNSPNGSASFTGLSVGANSYIIGYSTGPVLTPTGNVQKYGNICATAYIPSPNQDDVIFTPAISGIKTGISSVSFQFDLPDGILPQTNGAWAGLWRGDNPNFYGVPPSNTISLSPDTSSGRTAFNNVNLGTGLTYTIVIFMSGYQSGGGSTQRTAACSATFSV